jgi:serpin B
VVINADYAATIAKFYEAQLQGLNFASSSAAGVINGWCNQHTNGMIPKIIDETKAEAVAYVLNAIYFKAIWADKFDKDLTRKEQFTTAANIKKDVQMMNKTADYGYMETDTYQAVRLPYGNGAYSMVVLLPKASAKLCEVLAGMDGAKWKTLTSSMHEREVILKLPRFEIDTSTDLIDLLKNLGIVRAFDAFNAEFDKIADSGTLFISKMKQLARIEVNEEGTKAAAVTIAEMSYTTSVGPGPLPVEFYADHPFAYFITEQSSGAIFFMGTYEAPSNSPV